ncbi:MAG: hypothetical protein HYV34_00135 [Candidatus Kerfeldbacteria bacterium]|nr:hypothetical protein [Candidatus Kerfeldbacteria bacterium]
MLLRHWLVSLLAGFIAALFATPAPARTIDVPGDCGSIQVAIDIAVDGDTVFVHISDDPYAEDLEINGKSITLRGESQLEVAVDGTLNVDVSMWQEVSVEEMQIFGGISATGSRGGAVLRHLHILDHFEASVGGGYVTLLDVCSLSLDSGEHAEVGPLTNVTANGLLVLGRTDPPRFAFRNRGGSLTFTGSSLSGFQIGVVNVEGGVTTFDATTTFSDIAAPLLNLCGSGDIAGVSWFNCMP